MLPKSEKPVGVPAPDEDEPRHVNDGKPTAELKNGKIFKINTQSKDPAIDTVFR